jgi:hypothetical protein
MRVSGMAGVVRAHYSGVAAPIPHERPLHENEEYENLYSAHLAQAVDWQRVLLAICAVGDTLDGNSEKFDKGLIVETAIEFFSKGGLSRVDKAGCDLEDRGFGNCGKPIRLEVKFGKDDLRGRPRTQRAGAEPRVPDILKQERKTEKEKVERIVKNNHGNCTNELEQYADFFIILDTTNVFLCPYRHIRTACDKLAEDKAVLKPIIFKDHLQLLYTAGCDMRDPKITALSKGGIFKYRQRKMDLIKSMMCEICKLNVRTIRTEVDVFDQWVWLLGQLQTAVTDR